MSLYLSTCICKQLFPMTWIIKLEPKYPSSTLRNDWDLQLPHYPYTEALVSQSQCKSYLFHATAILLSFIIKQLTNKVYIT